MNGVWERNCGQEVIHGRVENHGPEGNRSREGNDSREVNHGSEGNHGPEGNHGREGNCERGQVEAGHFGCWNPKSPASILPPQYFSRLILFVVFFSL